MRAIADAARTPAGRSTLRTVTVPTEHGGWSLILVGTILGWSVALDAIAYKVPSLRRLLKAAPRPLIEDGRINQRAMRRELLTRNELETQLRLQGVSSVEDVAAAYLEPNGMIRSRRWQEPLAGRGAAGRDRPLEAVSPVASQTRLASMPSCTPDSTPSPTASMPSAWARLTTEQTIVSSCSFEVVRATNDASIFKA